MLYGMPVNSGILQVQYTLNALNFVATHLVLLELCGIGHMNSCLIMHLYVLNVCMLVRMRVGLLIYF